jgi:hypothetical protein
MTETKGDDINVLISREGLERHNESRLLEAELLHRLHQIEHFDRFKYDLTRDGEDHAAAAKRLSAERERLRERLRALGGPAGVPKPDPGRAALSFSRQELVAPRLGHAGEGPFAFGSEGCVPLPRPTDGISVVPDRSVTHGEIVTTALGPLGSVTFNGQGPSFEHPALGVDRSSGTERVWLHNWLNVVLFPCVSTASYLTYTFTADVDAELFSEADGMIMAFASLGEAPSASPSSHIDVNIPAGWLLIADLAEPRDFYNGFYGGMFGSLKVERTFEVPAGRTPAVAIVVGFVARLTSGELRLNFERDSGFGFGTGPFAPDAGRVCYRYTPIPIADPG